MSKAVRFLAFGVLAVMLAAGGLVAFSASAQQPKQTLGASDEGEIAFLTTNSLQRKDNVPFRFFDGPPITITGTLRFPAGAGPFPAVVLAHGCSGITNVVQGWQSKLREYGYATFVVDSFAKRHLKETCSFASSELSPVQRVPDVYGALKILATHPKIQADRIALMGFSHGGTVTVFSSLEWMRNKYAGLAGAAFRGFLPFYPFCQYEFPEFDRVAAPVRLHMGDRDDWLPVKACVDWVNRLRAAGFDATATLYPGAHHGFDNGNDRVFVYQEGSSLWACTLRLASALGPELPTSSKLDCAKRGGATIGGNLEARDLARANVQRELAQILR
jgi:dienelactone hydrolase